METKNFHPKPHAETDTNIPHNFHISQTQSS